jgi:hypothetical protein
LAEARGLSIDWVVADLRDYQPPADTFDAVLVAYLHLAQAELVDLLARLAQATRETGRIVVVGHDLSNLTDGIGGPPDPAVLYTPELVVTALPGLIVQRAERAKRPVPTDDGVRYAIDTVVTAVRP